jgi:hypothetical protein
MQADKFDLKIQELLTKTFNKQQGYNIEDAVMQNIQQKRNIVKLSKNNRKHSILLLVFTVILECTILFYPKIFATLLSLEQYPSIILGIQSALILCIMLQLDTIYRLIQTSGRHRIHPLKSN